MMQKWKRMKKKTICKIESPQPPRERPVILPCCQGQEDSTIWRFKKGKGEAIEPLNRKHEEVKISQRNLEIECINVII